MRWRLCIEGGHKGLARRGDGGTRPSGGLWVLEGGAGRGVERGKQATLDCQFRPFSTPARAQREILEPIEL